MMLDKGGSPTPVFLHLALLSFEAGHTHLPHLHSPVSFHMEKK